MTTDLDQPCYIIINAPDSETPKDTQLKQDIENGNIKVKTEALKKLIFCMLNGEKLPSNMLILVIRYLLPLQDHHIKKLLLLFWEIVPKKNNAGKLLPEMILVCDAYRKDLQHPNEFIRGSTLRFLCKLKEAELLEPLMPSIRSCLEHKHSYVRRNAVLAIYTIYRNFEFLIPDGPELIANFLEQEQDASCKRNAFIMLIHADQEKALNYLHSCMDQVQNFNDILQLVIVELIYKVCRNNPSERSRFIRCVYNLLNSSSNAVKYEAAGTLISISSAPTAIKAATSCYIDLIVKESDNNVKLIVLDKLLELKDQSPNNERVLQDMMMDVLRLLNSNDMEVKAKTLELALELTSSRNVQDLIGVLKKEIVRIRDAGQASSTGNSTIGDTSGEGSRLSGIEEIDKYKKMLIKTVRNCLFPKYPEILVQILPVLMECILSENTGPSSNSSESPAARVIALLRESVQCFPQMTNVVLPKLLDIYPTLKCSYVFRGTNWIIGEYADTPEYIKAFLNSVQKSLGKVPLIEDETTSKMNAEKEADKNDDVASSKTTKASTNVGKPIITPDGTYATQSAYEKKSGTSKTGKESEVPVLRKLLNAGDFFVASSLANDLTKAALKYAQLAKANSTAVNAMLAKVMLILASIIRFGKSTHPKKPITLDDADRIMLCLKVLANFNDPTIVAVFTRACRQSLAKIVEVQAEELNKYAASRNKADKHIEIQPDTEVMFMPLLNKGDLDNKEDQFESSLLKAIGDPSESAYTNEFQTLMDSSKLNKVTQLTGFSDPVYAEAYVDVVGRDIRLDVLVVNQTGDTLQHLDLELATLGDLKLVDKPTPVTLPPNDFCNIKASIKVTSTENGIIFGNIVYEVSASGVHVSNAVILNEIHIDIVDYVVAASASKNGAGSQDANLVSDAEFRRMWTEFEWENKVCVHRAVPSLTEEERKGNHGVRDELTDFLDFLITKTNMKCMTPKQALQGDCGFLAANLYAKSIFGEDALANLCVEKSRPHHEKSSADGLSPAKKLGHSVDQELGEGESNGVNQDKLHKELEVEMGEGGGVEHKSTVTIIGHVRIRAKTQGMALSLGDKINQLQKLKH